MLRRSWNWLDSRMGFTDYFGPLMSHLVPRDARWWYVFGSATLSSFMIQVLTGIGLAMAYVPSSGEAYQSLVYITNEAPFGSWLRGMHSFGASAMVLLCGLHMAQVFLHGSYKFPREMNWVTGVFLLLLTIVMGFTGQLMRWDLNAATSGIIAGDQLARVPFVGGWLAQLVIGGGTIGGQTLGRYFVVHVFIVPALIIALVGAHLMLIMRHGMSEMPKAGQRVDPATYVKDYEERVHKTGVPFWPDAAWRDMVFAFLVFGGVCLAGLFIGPPDLGPPPDPSLIKIAPAPDWFLLWYFGVLAVIPPAIEDWVITLLPMAAIALLFLVPFASNRGERHWTRRPWAVGVLVSLVALVGTTWIAGATTPWSPDFTAEPLAQDVVLGPLAWQKKPDGSPYDPARVQQGAQLFFDKGCIRCHQVDGFGGVRGPDLSEIGKRLTDPQLVIRINVGGVNMPAYGGAITHDDLDVLVEFLHTRTPKPPSDVPAGP